MIRKLFLVNQDVLNLFMSDNGISDNSVSEEIAKILRKGNVKTTPKAVAVRIGSIRKGETIATEEIFLLSLEKGLGMKKGTLCGKAVTKTDLQRMKVIKENQRQKVIKKIETLISSSKSRSLLIEKDLLVEIKSLL